MDAVGEKMIPYKIRKQCIAIPKREEGWGVEDDGVYGQKQIETFVMVPSRSSNELVSE